MVCPHWFHDVHAPLVAATPNARYVEFFWDDQVLNFRKLVDRQLTHKQGRVVDVYKRQGVQRLEEVLRQDADQVGGAGHRVERRRLADGLSLIHI